MEVFETGVFDKINSFPFSVVRIPGKSSNPPSGVGCSAIAAESLRIA